MLKSALILAVAVLSADAFHSGLFFVVFLSFFSSNLTTTIEFWGMQPCNVLFHAHPWFLEPQSDKQKTTNIAGRSFSRHVEELQTMAAFILNRNFWWISRLQHLFCGARLDMASHPHQPQGLLWRLFEC
jgi:hypothetical protein